MDVYKERIEPQKNVVAYVLFVSFFPQLSADSIEKSHNLLPQLQVSQKISYVEFKCGLMLILWGFIKKVIIGDRLTILGNHVYNHVLSLIVETFFAFRIYCDFSASLDIARDSAILIGVLLMKNFNSPYFKSQYQNSGENGMSPYMNGLLKISIFP